MIENSTLIIGENTLRIWFGKLLKAIGFNTLGDKIITRNSKKLITNPSAKLYNPFLLVISFTLDTSQKYQIVLQGDYKEKYKECEDGVINLDETAIFMLIYENYKLWFKKE